MNKWVRYRLGHNGNYSTWCFPTHQNFENSCPSTFLPASSVGGHRSILREGWIRALKRVGFRSKDACVPSHLLLSFLTMDKLLDFSHFLIWNMYQLQKLMEKAEWDAAFEYWPGAGGCLTEAGCWAGGGRSHNGGAGSSCACGWGGVDGCSGWAGISLLILWCLMPCPYRTFLLQPSPWWNGKVLSSLSWAKGHSWMSFFFLTIFLKCF